jgi:hypothetical protein
VHPCTGTEALYRPYGKVHPCTSTEALSRPYGKVHPCTGRTVKCTLVEALRLSTGRTVKCTVVQALRLCTDRTGYRGSRGIALPFLDHGTRRGEGSASRPARSLSPWMTRYPLYVRLGGPQARSGQVRKISPPPWFDPRPFQPLASRYTDLATRPT